MNYIVHFCKNPECNNCWVDEDLHNSTKPPRWKYCTECEAKGFKNPKRKKCTKTPEQIEAFKERMKAYRERLKCQKEEENMNQ